MIIPVGAPFQVQHLVLVVKHADGTAMTRTIAPVAFVPLVGH
jgi:protein-L-isoaspartate(D-aspartate) O-methyltransferase